MTTSTLSDSTRPGKRTWFSHLRLATLVLVFGLAVFEAQAVYTLQNWQYDGEIPQRPLTKMGGSDKYSFAISVVAAVVTLAAFIAQLVFAAAPPVWVELALTPAVGVLCFIILFVNANIFLGLAPILLFISAVLYEVTLVAVAIRAHRRGMRPWTRSVYALGTRPARHTARQTLSA